MPNIGTLTDMIACPGLDFCSLANAGTISVAKQIQQRFDDLDYLYDLGEIEIKMSGCMNACGHHHVGHIGILGVDKHGEEWYQITLGGSANGFTALGEVIGPSVPQAEVAATIERIVEIYRARARRRRALHRHAAPRRARTLQGARLCDTSCGGVRSSRTSGATSDEDPGSAAGVPLIVPLGAAARGSGARGAAAPGAWACASRPPTASRSSPLSCRGLSLVAVEFPNPGDGRGYSHGRLLRERCGSAASCARWARACARTRCFCWRAAASMPSSSPPARTPHAALRGARALRRRLPARCPAGRAAPAALLRPGN